MKLLPERAEAAAWCMEEVLAEHNHAVGGFHMARERPKFSAWALCPAAAP